MPAPKIAIIGSANPARNPPPDTKPTPDQYDPAVDVEFARQAAKAIGAELAQRGCRLVVYDSDNKFIEGEAVSGYVSSDKKVPGGIIVRQPQMSTPKLFAEEQTQPELFERRVDSSGQWEVSFYRSIAGVDGIVLFGGAHSALVAGQVAIGARVPVLPLEKSGGAASLVWKSLLPEVDLPTLDEHARMAHVFSASAVQSWVAALLDQRARRYRVETREIKSHAIWAMGMFVVSLVLAFGGYLLHLKDEYKVWALLFSTLFGGASGAAIRMVFERRYGTGPLVTPSMAVTMGLGMMSGGMAGLLYVVAQPGKIDLGGDTAIRLIAIVAVVSVVGGLTAETVLRKLLGIDVVRTQAIAAKDGPVAGKP